MTSSIGLFALFSSLEVSFLGGGKLSENFLVTESIDLFALFSSFKVSFLGGGKLSENFLVTKIIRIGCGIS